VHFRDFLAVVRRNSPGVFLASALVGIGIIVAAYRGRTPIIQYEADTAIVSIAIAGRLDSVWNLPAKTVAIPDVADDAPAPRTLDLGPGALLLPEGTRLTLIRMADAPLRIRIDGHRAGAEPGLVAAGLADDLALPQGSVITLSGSAGADASGCAHQLPPLALRGVGRLDIGASLASDSRDTPEDLAGLSDAEFLARNAQPLLDGGRVFVRGRTLVGTTFDADAHALQAGDQLRVPASAGGVFILQVRACAPLAVRGFVQSRGVELLRLGSDTSFARVSFWQSISRDPVLTFLVGLLGAFLATYWSFVNQRAEKA
jgi:hypothetical protein